ncbi:MAG: helix-turn-helix transcriptional regulator [Acidimicrobiia bacterium]|nr:helix-turn-helix transcriptional regulator [Acidimicrobiia bacterium]
MSRSSTTEPSPLARALMRVGDRWTLLIVDALLAGPARFGDLAETVAGIAPNTLSDRLRRLEAGGLLVSQPYSHRPPRREYRLTGHGAELAGALRLLAAWGAHRGGEATAPEHRACGTPLEARWFCPTCDRPVREDEGPGLAFA